MKKLGGRQRDPWEFLAIATYTQANLAPQPININGEGSDIGKPWHTPYR